MKPSKLDPHAFDGVSSGDEVGCLVVGADVAAPHPDVVGCRRLAGVLDLAHL
ncbi:hypothetical protein [Dactylosporangium sp. CA-233914]|uniref:hypothetical protein n=1 Tax=Dactylosporangium sp. CA-233914 TaxID=3239934 RepID=UPI003D9342B5